MVRAFVLIEAEAGQGNNIVRGLQQIPQIVFADRVTGPYDVISVIELDQLQDLGELIAEFVHKIDGILRTISCVSYIQQSDELYPSSPA